MLKIILASCVAVTLTLFACQKPESRQIHAPEAPGDEMTTVMKDIETIEAAPEGEYRVVILSLHDMFVDWFEAQRKWFEYRKKFPREPVSHIVFYNTGTKEIMAYAPVLRTLIGPPETIVRLTVDRSGTNEKALLGYYEGYDTAYATEVRSFHRLPRALSLTEARALGFDPSPRYLMAADFPELDRVLRAQITGQP